MDKFEDSEISKMEVDGVAVTIDELPDEILLVIFSNLDCDSLKQAALVSANWNLLIGAHSKTMKKFILNLDQSNIDKSLDESDEKFYSHRKHSNVYLYYEKEADHGFSILNKFDVSHVKCASVNRYNSSINVQNVVNFLKRMPQLEHASLVIVSVDVPKDFIVEPLCLPKLKQLRIYCGSLNVLTLFTPKQLTEVRIDQSARASHITELISFLQQAKKLKILRLNKETFNEIFKFDSEFHFQLDVFDMLYMRIVVPDAVGLNFNKFLLGQHSLTFLDLNGMENLPEAVYETIFSRLKHLKTLTVDGSQLPQDKDFYQRIHANEAIETLNIQKSFSSDEAAKGILAKSPNIKNLTLNFSFSNKIKHIAKFCQNLTNLSIESLQRSVSNEMKFNRLESLTVNFLETSEHVQSLIKACPKLNTLEIISGRINKDFLETITHKTSLKHLKLRGGFETMRKLFDVIKLNYGSLRTLDLNMRFPTTKTTIVASTNITFNFPERPVGFYLNDLDRKFAECSWKIDEPNYKNCFLCVS